NADSVKPSWINATNITRTKHVLLCRSADGNLSAMDKSAKPPPGDGDYWSLPNTGPRPTIFTSAWTWSILLYAALLVISAYAVLQGGYNIFAPERALTAAGGAVLLMYPAFRFGTIVSRILKARFPGDVSPSVETNIAAAASKPTDIKAKMAARKARVEKAKSEGKL
ncbi:MAG: hypothetical protein AAFQ84_09550, partial [Pseudomonadota bacterium]